MNIVRFHLLMNIVKYHLLIHFIASWWERFGEETPTLQKFAIRVLSLTTSASGCERNWSTFEQVRNFKFEHYDKNTLKITIIIVHS